MKYRSVNNHFLVSLLQSASSPPPPHPPAPLFSLLRQARLRRDHLAKQAAVCVSDQMYITGGIDIGAGASLTLSDVPAVRALQQVTRKINYDQPN